MNWFLKTLLAAIIFIVGLVVAGFAFFLDQAYSDELSDRALWFKELKVPNSPIGQKCCDISDGFPVEARMEPGGQWLARLIDDGVRPKPPLWMKHLGQWIAVPPPIVLDQVSIDERGYLFIWGGEMKCFVPPLQGF